MTFETHKVIYNSAEENKILLGKEVYFANDLLELSHNVEKENIGARAILLQVDDDTLPFKVKLPSGCETWVKLLYPIPEENITHIVKDEEKSFVPEPHYRPFNNISELEKRWSEINPADKPRFVMPLIWVSYKVENANSPVTIQMITAFTSNGVEMGAEFMSWEYLFEKMVFLDGTPCGVLVG